MSLRVEGEGNVFLGNSSSKKIDGSQKGEINIDFPQSEKDNKPYPGTGIEKTTQQPQTKKTYDKNGKVIQLEETYPREDNGKLCTLVQKFQRNDKGQVIDVAVSYDGVQNGHDAYEYNNEGKVLSQKMYFGQEKNPFQKYEYNDDGQIKTRIHYESGPNGEATTKEHGRWQRTYASPNDKFCTTESYYLASNGIKLSESHYDPNTGEEIKVIYFDEKTGKKVDEQKGDGYRLPLETIPE